MKKHFVRVASLILCVLFVVPLCACGEKSDDAQGEQTSVQEENSNDLTLDKLRDMTPEEAKAYFGTPDSEGDRPDGLVWFYNDRFTFYGSEIKAFSYRTADHGFGITFPDDQTPEGVLSKISELCVHEEREQSPLGWEYTCYSYGTMKIEINHTFSMIRFSFD